MGLDGVRMGMGWTWGWVGWDGMGVKLGMRWCGMGVRRLTRPSDLAGIGW